MKKFKILTKYDRIFTKTLNKIKIKNKKINSKYKQKLW